MNREIKFRGYSEELKYFVYGFLQEVDVEGVGYSYIFWQGNTTPVRADSVSQFSGLHDKNGKAIFEGDILEYVKLGGSKIFYKVFYKKGGLVINIHQDDFKKDNPLFYEPIADMQTSGFIEQNCTIIGNIYEHSHLIDNN